jgi:hypothetical protein
MYVADSLGYLGYAAFIIPAPKVDAALFSGTLLAAAALSMICLLGATIYLERLWAEVSREAETAPAESTAETLASAGSSAN